MNNIRACAREIVNEEIIYAQARQHGGRGEKLCRFSFRIVIMNVPVYLLDTVRSDGYTIYSTQ